MANIIYFQKCNLNEKNTPHSTGAKPKQNRVQHDQSARHNGNKRVIFLSFPHSVLYTTLRTFSPWFLFLKYTLTKRKKINFDRLIRYTSFVTIVTKTRTWWVSVDKSYWRRLPSIAISSSILFTFQNSVIILTLEHAQTENSTTLHFKFRLSASGKTSLPFLQRKIYLLLSLRYQINCNDAYETFEIWSISDAT